MSDSLKRTKLFDDVAGLITAKIRDEVWTAGQKIPSEVLLADLFCVSRDTVRTAIKVLQSEGILISRPGSGTYVSEEAEALLETRAFVRLRIPLLQLNDKAHLAVQASGLDGAAVQLHDLLGDGKSQPCAACLGRSGGIPAVELVEDHLQLILRHLLRLVGDGYADAVLLRMGLDINGTVFKAVGHRVFQNVVKHAGQSIRVRL